MDKDLYELPPAEQKAMVKQLPGSLDEVLDNLEKDHEFLLKGDVFTPGRDRDLDRATSGRTRSTPIRLRPHPYEFAPLLRPVSG